MAIRKLLVANRGEIALRVFRACRELGIATVAVAAPDDRGALHARSGDETVEIASYLASEEHVRAAREAGADAIHPGYGFLAENADFAEAVSAAGLTWVGPPPEALRAAGDKLEAKRLARDAGVPVVQTLHNYRLLCPSALLFRDGGVCEDCLHKRVKWPGVAHACYRGSRAASAVTAATTHSARRESTRPRTTSAAISKTNSPPAYR